MDGSNHNDDWCTIESDPGVFTEMIESLGCNVVEFSELYSLDDETLHELYESTKSIYGLIFLFQWHPDMNARLATNTSINREPLDESQIPDNLFFAQQVTTNACATQAILSVLFNATSATEGEETTASTPGAAPEGSSMLTKQELGRTLSDFQSFVMSFPPHLKGVAISSSDELKKAHNAFSRPDALYLNEDVRIPKSSTEKGEAFHFVAYIPHGTSVYELDGLQTGPIVIGQIDATAETSDGTTSTVPSWISVARSAIQQRMIAAGEENVKFNLMAVIHDKRVTLQTKLTSCHDDDAMMQDVDETANNKDMIVAQLEMEHGKREQWNIENQRRRHNYVPFCIQLLRELASIPTATSATADASSSTCLLTDIVSTVREKRQKAKGDKSS